MGKGSKRRPGSNYEENYSRIFGEVKPQTSYTVFDGKDKGKRSGIYVVGDIEPFKSPVTGEIISSRSQLRQHNREHGVTDSRDYSASFFEKKAKERDAALNGQSESDRKHRIEILREKFNR
jgi:hypothetical protein